MITPQDEHELVDLARTWVEARPFGRPRADDVAVIPAPVQALLTTVEPYRSQALADARRFLALPKPIGFGLTATLAALPETAPCAGWARSIRLLQLHLAWAERMDGGYTDSADETIAQVAWEDGRWVVVQLWDAALRRQAEAWLARCRQVFHAR